MKKLKNFITPRNLAKILAVLALVLTILLFQPMNLVFQGEWILNQSFEVVEIENLQIPFSDVKIPIGLVSFRFYSILVTTGVLAGYFLAIYLAKWNLVVSSVIDRLFIGIVLSSFLGARLFYVLFNWNVFYNPVSWQDTLSNITLGINRGGLAIFGGILVAIIYIFIYCKKHHFNFFEFADFLAPGLLLGQIIGRFGNFFNYEAFGPSTKVLWKMFVPQDSRPNADLDLAFYHPTFLYEIIPNFLLLLFILYNYSKFTEKKSGLILGIYALGYGLIRFITEFYRLDALVLNISDLSLGFWQIQELRVSQISALLLALLGLYWLATRNKILYLKKDMTEIKYS